MKKIKVLITGAGAPGAPGIIKSLRNNFEREIEIIGVDMNKQAVGFTMVDKSYIVPKANDPLFIEKVLEIAIKENVNVIQPLVTKELFEFSKNIKLFDEKGIKVSVDTYENLLISNDKGKLIKIMSENGLETPEYKIVKTYEEFLNSLDELGYPQKPVCFKPTIANGSRGFRIISSDIDKKSLLFDYKPNSTYISYEEIKEILKDGKFPELIVMEYLPGEEYSVDTLACNGKTLYAIPRLRTRMNGGISTGGIVELNNEIIEYSTEIIKLLKLNGNIGIQVKKSIDGKFKILEINPRVQGTIVLCSAAGINLPYYGIKLALGEDIPKKEINWNTSMTRYWEEVYYDSNGHAFTY